MVLHERLPYTTSGETAAARERSFDVGDLSSKLFEKVLVPLELDTDVKPLTSLAADLAEKFHSQILLIHVVPHEPTLARDPAILKERRAEVERVAAKLLDAGAVQVQCLLQEGNPAHHIEQTAREHNVSLILLSDRTEVPQGHAWFGTLTQKLARRVHAPLMVVKSYAATALKPVLCVVDFSDSSRSALSHAIAVARHLATNLTVLHVVPEPLPFPLVEGPIWQTYSGQTRESKAAYRTTGASSENSRSALAARRQLEEFLREFNFDGIAHDTVVTCGSPVLEVLNVAKERKCGLIAIGSDHRSGFVHFMSQSTAETLAETADVPVLIFRSEGERPALVQAEAFAHRATPIN